MSKRSEMFGYLTPYKEKLSEEDRRTYQAYYCGLCSTLKARFGRRSQLVLAYDLVFLALLSNALYEQEESYKDRLCIYRMKKVPQVGTEALSYAADMNLLLSYQNFRDRVHDSGSVKAAAAVKLLDGAYRKTADAYPRQKDALERYMEALHACEASDDADPDTAANLTGEMLSEVFLQKEDEYTRYLKPVFYNIGKFIYLSDAFEDVEEDERTGAYNPYKPLFALPDFEPRIREHLESILGDGAMAFECLPLFRHREILRNILYSGMWLRFSEAAAGRKKKTEND